MSIIDIKWKYKDEERPYGRCYDCRKPYEDCGDCLIPDDIWEQINPTYHEGAGILCANCIINRLHIIGVSEVQATLI